MLIFFIEFGHLLAALASDQQDVVDAYNHSQSILTLNQVDVPDRVSEVVPPDMPDSLRIVDLATASSGNVLSQEKAHQISIIEPKVASFILQTHRHSINLSCGLIAHQMAGRLELF